MTLSAAGTRHPAAPLPGWSRTLVRNPASAGMEPHGESSGRDDRGAGGRVRHDGCRHTGCRAPQRAAAADRSAPYRAVLIINGARPGIGTIVPHLGAVLPSSRSGQAGYHAT